MNYTMSDDRELLLQVEKVDDYYVVTYCPEGLQVTLGDAQDDYWRVANLIDDLWPGPVARRS